MNEQHAEANQYAKQYVQPIKNRVKAKIAIH